MREIRKTFPEAPEIAIAVAECESPGLKMVQSGHQQPYGQERSFGIFQIHEPDWHSRAISIGLPDYQTDVEQNIQMARHVYEVQGWRAWTCYWHPDYLAMN